MYYSKTNLRRGLLTYFFIGILTGATIFIALQELL